MRSAQEYLSFSCFLDLFPELRAQVHLINAPGKRPTVRVSDPELSFRVDMTLEQSIDLMEKVGRALVDAGFMPPTGTTLESVQEDMERAIVDISASLTLLQNLTRSAPEMASKEGE